MSTTPERNLLTDDEADLAHEQAAEAARAAAYDAVYRWGDKDLHPWSIGREQLYFKLRAVNCAIPFHLSRIHHESFLGDALIILYLCSHEPEAWRHLRSDPLLFVEAIEAWALTAIPRGQQSQAHNLAIRILTDAIATKAIQQPRGDGDGEDRLGE